MKKTLISFDWALKGVLRDKANFGVLSGLLTELLGREVTVYEILESESNRGAEFGKSNRLDLKAKIDDGEIAIFEVQVGWQGDFFQRILYGTSKAVVEQLYKGDEFGKIKKVYSVDIVYFELGKGSDYIYHGITDFKGLHNKETLLLSDREVKFLSRPALADSRAGVLFPEYYLVYPDKFDEENIRNKLDEWVYLLKTSTVKSEFTAAGIQEAGEALHVARMTDEERIDYEDHLKFIRVKNSDIKSSMFLGELKGEVKGEKRKASEIAKNLKSDGMTTEKIAKMTGMTAEEIEAL